MIENSSRPQAILQAWIPFKEAVGVTRIRNEADYAQTCATVQILLDAVGGDETHPLVDVLDYLSDQMKAYEDERCLIPEASAGETLRFLMDQHGLKQEDLADCAPQSRISEILNGKRQASKAIAKKLAQRFNVGADLFL
jgi:HTH-type transcriptional regulator/antitoxin HigA